MRYQMTEAPIPAFQNSVHPLFSPHPLLHTPLPPAEGPAGLHVASGLTACVQQARAALGDMILA